MSTIWIRLTLGVTLLISVSMAEIIEYHGSWELPDSLGKSIDGTLRIRPNDFAVLDLRGSFPIKKIMKSYYVPLIIGSCSLPPSSDKDKYSSTETITLKDCTIRSISSSENPSSLVARTAFVGVHFRKKEEVKFKEIFIKYSYLHDWVGKSGFVVDKAINQERVNLSYAKPKTIKVTSFGNFTISICFEVLPNLLKFRFSPYAREEVELKQETYIKIESDVDRHYDGYCALIRKIQNFLSLAISEPIYVEYLDGGVNSRTINTEGKEFLPPVQIFDTFRKIRTRSREILPHEMPFTYKMVENQLSDLLKRWLEDYDKYTPAHNSYFGTIYNEELYLENRFLTLVRAIEGYHRITHESFKTDKKRNAHKKRLQSIIDSVDEKFKSWVGEKLKFSHEPSFRKRIKELLEETEEISKFLFDSNNDKKDFVNKVVETRNLLVHPDGGLIEVGYGNYLGRLIREQLKPLLVICLYRNLGFSFSDIRRFLSRHPWYGSCFKD